MKRYVVLYKDNMDVYTQVDSKVYRKVLVSFKKKQVLSSEHYSIKEIDEKMERAKKSFEHFEVTSKGIKNIIFMNKERVIKDSSILYNNIEDYMNIIELSEDVKLHRVEKKSNLIYDWLIGINNVIDIHNVTGQALIIKKNTIAFQ